MLILRNGLLGAFVVLLFGSFEPAIDLHAVIEKMLNTVIQLKGVQYRLRSTERIKDDPKLKNALLFTKVMEQPVRKFYIRIESEDHKGTEMLYAHGENNDKIKVSANWVPTLNLSPFSSFLTKGQRHTPYSTGYMPVYRIIGAGLKKADLAKRFTVYFNYEGEVDFYQHKCYKIRIKDPEYAYINYKALPGETAFSIATKFAISEYAILERNDISYFDDDLSGKTLSIPSSYAKESVLYIEISTHLPLLQEMSDERGVFEKYEFFNVVVNPNFAADEFKPSFKGYNF